MQPAVPDVFPSPPVVSRTCSLTRLEGIRWHDTGLEALVPCDHDASCPLIPWHQARLELSGVVSVFDVCQPGRPRRVLVLTLFRAAAPAAVFVALPADQERLAARANNFNALSCLDPPRSHDFIVAYKTACSDLNHARVADHGNTDRDISARLLR